jgi:hypothetical protein
VRSANLRQALSIERFLLDYFARSSTLSMISLFGHVSAAKLHAYTLDRRNEKMTNALCHDYTVHIITTYERRYRKTRAPTRQLTRIRPTRLNLELLFPASLQTVIRHVQIIPVNGKDPYQTVGSKAGTGSAGAEYTRNQSRYGHPFYSGRTRRMAMQRHSVIVAASQRPNGLFVKAL